MAVLDKRTTGSASASPELQFNDGTSPILLSQEPPNTNQLVGLKGSVQSSLLNNGSLGGEGAR